MSTESLSRALSARRGKGLDPSMIRLGGDDIAHQLSMEHKDQDVRDGFQVADGGGTHVGEHAESHKMMDKDAGLNSSSKKGERQGTPNVTGKTQYDRESPTHLDEHTKVEHEGQKPSPPASRKSKGHLDEHIMAAHEHHQEGEPASQSTGMGFGELESDIKEAIAGHHSQYEYDHLKKRGPRSLAERAKMAVLKDKYEDHK